MPSNYNRRGNGMRSGWAGTGAIAATGLLAGLLGGWKLATGVTRQMPTTHGEWVKFTNAAPFAKSADANSGLWKKPARWYTCVSETVASR